jgi:hypothetical protein
MTTLAGGVTLVKPLRVGFNGRVALGFCIGLELVASGLVRVTAHNRFIIADRRHAEAHASHRR